MLDSATPDPNLFEQAGPQQSPRRHRRSARSSQQLHWTPQTRAIAMTLGLVTLGLGSGYALLTSHNPGKTSGELESVSLAYPTALPWIEHESACSGAHQTWKNGFCFDSEHSPSF